MPARRAILGVVSFGGTRVQEKATIQAFFAPENKIAFYTEGREPAVLEVLATGSFSTALAPFGPKFTVPVPLVLTVPGAPYASVLSIKGKLGAAYKQGKKLISYGTVPKTCPKGELHRQGRIDVPEWRNGHSRPDGSLPEAVEPGPAKGVWTGPNPPKPSIHGLPVRADAGTRTPDPFITSEVLYQLSYVGAAMDASDVSRYRLSPAGTTARRAELA